MKTIIIRIELESDEYERYKRFLSLKEIKDFISNEGVSQLECYIRSKEGIDDTSEFSHIKL